jgi:hypothetical protein
VIYGPGDHFSFHKDTPEKNLCGTFLISLFEDCEPKDGFETSHGDSTVWSSAEMQNGWCAFYPDIPHRVNVLESGYRAILSFKIFVEEPGVKEPRCQSWGEVESNLVNTIVDGIEKAGFPLGILMKNHYGYDMRKTRSERNTYYSTKET